MSAIGDDARRTLAELARARRARRAGGGDSPPVKARVRCGGEWHRIALTPDGRLSFLDHTLEEVRQGDFPPTGETCRCSLVLFYWRLIMTRWEAGQGEGLPKALRAAAWERRRFGLARRAARPGLKYLNDLAIGPFHQRPRCLTEVISRLTFRLWGWALGVFGYVWYSGPGRGHANELMLLLMCWTREKISRGKLFQARGLPRDWYSSVCRAGLACHEGYLVVRVEKPEHYDKGVDLVFYRCRPVLHPDRVDFERDRVWVARGPAGDFRVVRREWWHD
jgi:hypothetical protein